MDPLTLGSTAIFSLLLGLGLGRRGNDRTPILWASAATAVIGLITWIVASGSSETIGAWMTIGGAIVAGTVALTGRRPVTHDA